MIDNKEKESKSFKISDSSWVSVGMLSVFIACTVWLIGTLKDLQGSIDKVDNHLKAVDIQIQQINENSVTKKDLRIWGFELKEKNPEGIKVIPVVD